MSTERNAPRFPLRETLAGFFRMDHRQRVSIPALAVLLGAADRQVREVLRLEGVELRVDSIEWGEAAACVFDAWPRAQVIGALGPGLGHLIPPAFHPAPVNWRIPIFILRAIQHQAALMRDNDPRLNASAGGRFTSPSVDDYVADILFNEIEPATVSALAHDAAFLQAFHYPPID